MKFFRIVFDNQTESYFAGQTVSGKVHLYLTQPKKIKGKIWNSFLVINKFANDKSSVWNLICINISIFSIDIKLKVIGKCHAFSAKQEGYHFRYHKKEEYYLNHDITLLEEGKRHTPSEVWVLNNGIKSLVIN